MAPDAQRQLASLPFALVVLRPGGAIAAVNPAAEQLLGSSSRRLIDRTVGDVLTFGDATLSQRIIEPDAQVSARAVAAAVTGGPSHPFDVTVAPIVDAPGWKVLTLHDLGGVEALAGEDGPLRAPDILAHEIKNPLAGIRGAAQLLARKLGEQDRSLTMLIVDEVDRIAKLIDQMQTLSRRTAEPVAPCNLHEAIRRARAVLEAGRALPPIVEEFDPSLPPVLGNADALVQVVLNLIANAADACASAPEPRLVVRTRFASGLQLQASSGGNPVRLPIELRISDNGEGIDAALRDHVFEPFVSSKQSGQGLGLALARRLVRDMNGRIGHDRDDAGRWTHFHVHLPVASERRSELREKAA